MHGFSFSVSYCFVDYCFLLFLLYPLEMDWDQSGRVTFKEFLFAVEGWVGLEDEEEE